MPELLLLRAGTYYERAAIGPKRLNASQFDLDKVGVTAGASAPEILVHEVLEKLRSFGISKVREMEAEPEGVTFPLPSSLKHKEVQHKKERLERV